MCERNGFARKGVYETIHIIIIAAQITFHVRYDLDKKHQGKNQAKQVLTRDKGCHENQLPTELEKEGFTAVCCGHNEV